MSAMRRTITLGLVTLTGMLAPIAIAPARAVGAAGVAGGPTVTHVPGNVALGSLSLDVVVLKRQLGEYRNETVLRSQATADLTNAERRNAAMRFDEATRDAVLRFQRSQGLAPTGTFTSTDWQRLFAFINRSEADKDPTAGAGPATTVTRNPDGSQTVHVTCPKLTRPNQRAVAFLADFTQRGRTTMYGIDEFDGMAHCSTANIAAIHLGANPNRVPGGHHYGIAVRTFTDAADRVAVTSTLDTHLTFRRVDWAPVTPNAPTGVQATLGPDLGKSTITWTHTGSPGWLYDFDVQALQRGSNGTWQPATLAAGQLSKQRLTSGGTFVGLTPGIEYAFTVTATNRSGFGVSAPSAASNAVTPPVTVARSLYRCSVPTGTYSYRLPKSDYHQLDVFPRQAGTTSRGTIVYVHGGGFVHTTPDARKGNQTGCPAGASGLEMGAIEAQRSLGWDLVAISYRPSDTGTLFPEPLVDVGEAIKWVRGPAGWIGVDGRRVVVVGHSAGGTLAALAGAYSGRVVPGTSEPFPVIDGWIALGAPMSYRDTNAGQNISRLVHGKVTNSPANTLGLTLADADPWTQLGNQVRMRGVATPPGYLIHGTEDPIIPISNAEAVDQLSGLFELDRVDPTRNPSNDLNHPAFERNHSDHYAIGGADARRLNAWFAAR